MNRPCWGGTDAELLASTVSPDTETAGEDGSFDREPLSASICLSKVIRLSSATLSWLRSMADFSCGEENNACTIMRKSICEHNHYFKEKNLELAIFLDIVRNSDRKCEFVGVRVVYQCLWQTS